MAADLLERADLVPPAHLWVPEYSFTAGPEVADLGRMVGFTPDAQQELALDITFAETGQGIPAAFLVAVLGARQNIKTGVMKLDALGWLFLLKVMRVVYTAHDWNPACADMFRDMKNLIEGSSWLSRRVRRIYEGNGEESIELMSGAQMLFKTRTKAGGRSMACDKLLADEGFALQPAHIGSLLPTMSTRRQAQIVVGSSACKPESVVLRDYVDRGRAGDDPSLAYIEWCAPPPAEACASGDACDHGKRTPGCGCDNPEFWRQANPAVASGRITIEYIAKERRNMPPKEFGRERMGWHDAPLIVLKERSPIDLERWRATELDVDDDGTVLDPGWTPPPISTFGVEMDPDRAWASIGGAGVLPLPDGRRFVELIQRDRLSNWVVPRCKRLEADHGPAVFVIDGGGPAEPLIKPLTEAGLTVVTASGSDIVTSCAAVVDLVNDYGIVHGPQAELDEAVEGARPRMWRDGGFSFGRRASGVDVSPLLSITLALWGLDNAASFAMFGDAELEMCDRCAAKPHGDPDGRHDYLCTDCREEPAR